MTFAERVIKAAEQAKADGYTKLRFMVAESDWPPSWPNVEFISSRGERSSLIAGNDDPKQARLYPLEEQ